MEQLFRQKNRFSPIENKITLARQWHNWLISLAIFGLALWYIGANLAHFVTTDEHNWIYRSGLFLHAFLTKDWSGTSVWLTPGVTTTWLGSLGLSLYYQSHAAAIDQPFSDWLVSFARNKIDLDVLLALRWVAALFNAGMLVLIYNLARRLWSWPVAFLGTLLLLMEPHLLSVSRIIGHDALTTYLIAGALLSFIYALSLKHERVEVGQPESRRDIFLWIILSGIMTGLAVLSKATALVLLPFCFLIAFINLKQRLGDLKFWMMTLAIWGGVAWLTFILVWPAAWVDPLGQIWAIISNAFFYSAGSEDAEELQGYWRIPDLGIWYYVINGAFKLNPLTMGGLLLAGIAGLLGLRSSQKRQLRLTGPFWGLLLFAIIFTIFISAGAKKSPRYILPVFPALVFMAAWGWLNFFNKVRPAVVVAGVGGLALLITSQYAPYYFTYFNPLLGGAYTAPRLIRIGWGEGLDEVGRWLETQPEARAKHLGVEYTATVRPFYSGPISSPVSPGLDYVAFYIKQSQSGYPAPEILAYFEQQGALHHVILNGIDYAQVYQGPAMEPIETEQEGLPLAYRPATIYAPIGQPFSVDLLWPANFEAASNQAQAKLSLQAREGSYSLEAVAPIIRQSAEVVISQHQFHLPADMPRDSYVMLVDDVPVGQVEARLMATPAGFSPLSLEINSQVKLVGFKQTRQHNNLVVDLAWQGVDEIKNDYTVFVQLLDANGERLTGTDTAPERGFTTLDRKEIMLTRHIIPIPAQMKPGAYKVLMGLYYFAGDQPIDAGKVVLDKPVIL